MAVNETLNLTIKNTVIIYNSTQSVVSYLTLQRYKKGVDVVHPAFKNIW